MLITLLCTGNHVFSQHGFTLENNLKKDYVSFQLVNNLVIVPVEVNGVKLSFLLDTGVNATILFSLVDRDSLELKNAKPIRIRGMGEGGSINALQSDNNELRIGRAVDKNHSIYVIFDKSLNFSPRMGIPIHGIVGYDFFKKFIVKTDYGSKKVVFYDPAKTTAKICRKCEVFDLTFYNNKPYIDINVSFENKEEEVTLLVDSGSSDALWLFDEQNKVRENPKNYFDDYLGLGLSGSVYGKRSKLKKARLASFNLTDINVAFPSTEAVGNIQLYKERDGSLGGAVLKRFTVIMDYPSNRMILRKNSYFKEPFHYNMSGLTVEHDGLIPVKEVQQIRNQSLNSDQSNDNNGAISFVMSPAYNFFLAPKFVVAEVREGSPAALAGIQKGDEIYKVNGRSFYKYKLYELIDLFSNKEGKKVYMELSRDGKAFRAKFTLKRVL